MKWRMQSCKHLFTVSMSVLLAGLLVSCGQATKHQVPKYNVTDVNKEQVKSNGEFALRLAKPLLASAADERRNTVFSPLSVSLALSLALNGAQGETKAELLKLLAASDEGMDDINRGNEVLMDLLQHGDSKVEFDIANSIWARNELPLQSDYVNRMKELYAAPVNTADFNHADETAHTINGWVNKETKGKIKELVNKNEISKSSMILLNAVYFQGVWQDPFDKSETRDSIFHTDSGQDVEVPMMSLTAKLFHKSTPYYEAVQIPYGAGDWRMIAALPAPGQTLKEAEAALLSDVDEWTTGFQKGDTLLQLPRFKLEDATSLGDTLKALGLVRSMNSKQADFTGISEEGQLYINEVLHKASVKVSEEGTEAAAATAIMMDSGSSQAPSELFQFRGDRPFLFAILNQSTGIIVLIGSLADPSATTGK